MKTTTLHLHKQNFKFSSAHFLIFDAHSAERLHGHNYQVAVDLKVPSGFGEESGYFVDFNIFKKHIKARLDQWDEHILMPALQPEMKFEKKGKGKGLQVLFRDREYLFPQEEVILLQIKNTSVEELSSLLAHDFLQAFKSYGVRQVRVRVEETRGQGASTTATLDGTSDAGGVKS
jgi:6-pyruvoyltetrahydropterin/6-carboxytetrahydropterin synthase